MGSQRERPDAHGVQSEARELQPEISSTKTGVDSDETPLCIGGVSDLAAYAASEREPDNEEILKDVMAIFHERDDFPRHDHTD